jgi:hypothetical protein
VARLGLRRIGGTSIVAVGHSVEVLRGRGAGHREAARHQEYPEHPRAAFTRTHATSSFLEEPPVRDTDRYGGG